MRDGRGTVVTKPSPARDAAVGLAAALAPRLALLRAVAEEGTVTAAAARLGLPQPTASRWLAALTDQVGAPVVVRDGRGVRLSRAGRHLAEAADGALAVLETGCRRVTEDADPERGQVVLAFLHTMGESRVPSLLRAFRAEHPGIRFALSQGAQEDTLARIATGAADLALTSPLPDRPGFDGVAVAEQPLVLTLPADHRLAGRRSARLAEVAAEPFVGLKAGYGLRKITDALCQAEGFTPELAFEGEEIDTLRGLVAAGLGVAVLPAAEQPTPTVEVPLHPPATRQIGLVWAADRPLAPAARAFREFVLAARPR